MTGATDTRAGTGVAPHPVRLAMEARDFDAFKKQLSPDMVLRSPVTSTPVVGAEAIALIGFILEEYEEVKFVGEWSGQGSHVLATRGRMGGRRVDVVDVMRVDGRGQVVEMRIHARPMSGTATFAAVIGPRLARRNGSRRARVVAALARPLPAMLSVVDRLAAVTLSRPPGWAYDEAPERNR